MYRLLDVGSDPGTNLKETTMQTTPAQQIPTYIHSVIVGNEQDGWMLYDRKPGKGGFPYRTLADAMAAAEFVDEYYHAKKNKKPLPLTPRIPAA